MSEGSNGFSLPEEALKALEGADKTPEEKLKEFESALSAKADAVGDILANGTTPNSEQISGLTEAVKDVLKFLKGHEGDSELESKYEILLSEIKEIAKIAKKPAVRTKKDEVRVQAALGRFCAAINGSPTDLDELHKVPLLTFLGLDGDSAEEKPSGVALEGKKPEKEKQAASPKRETQNPPSSESGVEEILKKINEILAEPKIDRGGKNVDIQNKLTEAAGALGNIAENTQDPELKQFVSRLIPEFVAVKQAVADKRFVDADRLLARAIDAYGGTNEAWDSIDQTPAERLVARKNPNHKARYLVGEPPKRIERKGASGKVSQAEKTEHALNVLKVPAAQSEVGSSATEAQIIPPNQTGSAENLTEETPQESGAEVPEESPSSLRQKELRSLRLWGDFENLVRGWKTERLEVSSAVLTKEEFVSGVIDALTEHFPEEFKNSRDSKEKKRIAQEFISSVPQPFQGTLAEVVLKVFPGEGFGAFNIAKPEQPIKPDVLKPKMERPRIKARPNEPEQSTAPSEVGQVEGVVKENPEQRVAKATLKLQKKAEAAPPALVVEYEAYTKDRLEKIDVNAVLADSDFMTYLTKGVQERGVEVASEVIKQHYANYKTALMLADGYTRAQLGIIRDELGLGEIDSKSYQEMLQKQFIEASYQDLNFHAESVPKIEALNQYQRLPALIAKLEARLADVSIRAISRDLIEKKRQEGVHNKALKAGWFSGTKAFFEWITNGGSLSEFKKEIAANERSMAVSTDPAHREIFAQNIKKLREKFARREEHEAREEVSSGFTQTNPGFFRYVLNGITDGFAKKELRKIREETGKLEREKTTYEKYADDISKQKERLASLRTQVLGSIQAFEGAMPFLEQAVRDRVSGNMSRGMEGLSEAAKMFKVLTVLNVEAGSSTAASMKAELTIAIERQIQASIKKMLDRAITPEKGKSPLAILEHAMNEWVKDETLLNAEGNTKARVRYLLETARETIPQVTPGSPDPQANQMKRFYLNMLIEKYSK